MVERFIVFILLFLAVLQPLKGEETSSPVQAHLYSDHLVIEHGQSFSLLIAVNLAPEWHLYWKNPGDTGIAPSIAWNLPKGLEITQLSWATPERFELGDLITYGYANEALLLVTLKADNEVASRDLTLQGTMSWIACSHDNCVPGKTTFESSISLGPQAVKNSEAEPLFTKAYEALPKLLPQAKVEQKDNVLLVAIPKGLFTQENLPIQFFPEEPGIDHHKPVSLSVGATTSSSEEIIALHTTEEEPTQLKGLLKVGQTAFQLDLPIENIKVENEDSNLGLVWGLIFAFLGGLLLNLMPCVLPVISLKIMSFVKLSGESRLEMSKHGLSFTMGVLISFWALAGLLLFMQATGHAVGWGFQLQDPLVIALMTILFLLLSLNLFGVFEFGTSIASLAGEAAIAKKEGYKSSFISGVFATAVATPCTGPFMGSALGYALTQPNYVSLAIFTALGLGMAFPYLAIGFFPKLIRWLPRPGAWMESFKQFLGFLMLATVIWFLWIFLGQTTETSLFLMLLSLLVISVGAWTYGKWAVPYKAKIVRVFGISIATLCFVAGLGISHIASQDNIIVQKPSVDQLTHKGWEAFSPERFETLRAQNIPVLIDFTAKWCLICQANHLVLSHTDVEKKFDEKGIVRMKADWTKYDPVITAELQKHGRNGVPLYVLYGNQHKPQILPQILTTDSLISAADSLPNALR